MRFQVFLQGISTRVTCVNKYFGHFDSWYIAILLHWRKCCASLQVRTFKISILQTEETTIMWIPALLLGTLVYT